MKLLLDENLPLELRREISGHECFTVAYMQWKGVANGELLRRAAAAGFDALITNDAHMRYQQNLQSLPVAVVVLHAASNDMDDITPLIPKLLDGLNVLTPRTLVVLSA